MTNAGREAVKGTKTGTGTGIGIGVGKKAGTGTRKEKRVEGRERPETYVVMSRGGSKDAREGETPTTNQ